MGLVAAARHPDHFVRIGGWWIDGENDAGASRGAVCEPLGSCGRWSYGRSSRWWARTFRPGTWSTQHGDMRVPHFLGLHRFQLIAIRKRRIQFARKQTIFAFAIAASYSQPDKSSDGDTESDSFLGRSVFCFISVYGLYGRKPRNSIRPGSFKVLDILLE